MPGGGDARGTAVSDRALRARAVGSGGGRGGRDDGSRVVAWQRPEWRHPTEGRSNGATPLRRRARPSSGRPLSRGVRRRLNEGVDDDGVARERDVGGELLVRAVIDDERVVA